MSRLIIRSIKEDIKGFMNLVPHRIEKISEAANKPLPHEYGVNALASRLHPKEQKLIISSVESLSDEVKIITLTSAENKPLAFFRAGQNIIIKAGSFSTPFSLVSSPDETDYKIAVFSQASDAVSQFLWNRAEGDIIETSDPQGFFYYTSLRDKDTVIAVCDSFGAPAVLSMLNSIKSGNESYKLKIYYCDTKENFVFRNLFIEDSTEFIKKPADATEKIKSLPSDSYSLFISGNSSFYDNAVKAANQLNLSAGRIRFNIITPAQTSDAPAKEFNCRVIYRDTEFEFICFGNETLLSAFERNGIPSPAKCKIGECGFCRCRLVEGEIETINCAGVDSRRSADKKYNFIHPCRAFAKSDITLAL